jgi:DNA-directed RNA polymerase specialized sigma24 family protein
VKLHQDQMPHEATVTVAHDGLILMLWKQGLDTYEIAKRIGLREHQVANRLLRIREACK